MAVFGAGELVVEKSNKPRIFVVGGARGIGFWFARNVLAQHLDRYDVHICDVETPKTVAPNSDFFWFRVEYKDGFIDELPEDIGDSDIIILSVPVSRLDELLGYLSCHISGGPQIVNFSSVQKVTNDQIKLALPGKCRIYGLHLLFGPGVSHPAGNSAVVTDLESHMRDDHVADFLGLTSSSGLFLEYSSAEKHDEMMQILQVGVHFTFFGFAQYLADRGIDFSELLKYRTLPAGFFLSFMARALSQPKLTYANIQLQDGGSDARKGIIDAMSKLDQAVSLSVAPKEVEAHLRGVSDAFKPDDLLEGVAATQAAIKAYELASRQIHDAVETEKIVGISVASQTKSGSDIRIGFVASEQRGAIEFDDRLRLLAEEIDGYSYALLRNEASITYFASKGLNFSEKIYPLSKKRFRFLPEDYVSQWIRDNVARATMSFPVSFIRFDPEAVSRLEQVVPLASRHLETVTFGKLFIRDDRVVTAVCFVEFESAISSEQARVEVLIHTKGVLVPTDQ